jgi:hypothetical protein
MYSQATGSEQKPGDQNTQAGGEQTKTDGDGKKVENADYEVVDDDKK